MLKCLKWSKEQFVNIDFKNDYMNINIHEVLHSTIDLSTYKKLSINKYYKLNYDASF